jgi:hypothetical protein
MNRLSTSLLSAFAVGVNAALSLLVTDKCLAIDVDPVRGEPSSGNFRTR